VIEFETCWLAGRIPEVQITRFYNHLLHVYLNRNTAFNIYI